MISNHLLYKLLTNNIRLNRTVFHATKYVTLKKIRKGKFLLIKLWSLDEGAQTFGRTCNPKTGYFHDKPKIS